ncbi:hypothetical protein [Spiroplasma endosymbiont of Amphibalanus improvisus]|uniref:hypothetical protein n=1 Tax=Spiroplasma endosymbiont of Amphibalanus improvisus TaxID=3066327 RepID=UPI00313D645F
MDYKNLYKSKVVDKKPIDPNWMKQIAKNFNHFIKEMDLDFLNCVACNQSESEVINKSGNDDYKPIEVRNKKVCHHDLEDGFQFSRVVSDDGFHFKCINVDLIKCWANKFNPCACHKKEAASVACSYCGLIKPQITKFDNKNYCSLVCIKKSLNN